MHDAKKGASDGGDEREEKEVVPKAVDEPPSVFGTEEQCTVFESIEDR
jgi:hypothetical protein